MDSRPPASFSFSTMARQPSDAPPSFTSPPLPRSVTPLKRPHARTTSERPSLSRLPTTSSSNSTIHARHVSNPTGTPSATPGSAGPSPNPPTYYFGSQPASQTKDVRSPGLRRPPASFSSAGRAYGDTSRGPPISASGTWPKQDTPTQSVPTHSPLERVERMPISNEDSAARGAALRRRLQESRRDSRDSRYGDTPNTSGAEGDGGEDLFLNLAEDSNNNTTTNITTRTDRVRSRIARSTRGSSLPTATTPGSSPLANSYTRPNGAKIPAAIDTQVGSQFRRASLLPSATRTARESSQSPITPANPGDALRTHLSHLPPKRSFNSSFKDSELSPMDFLAQLDANKKDRRPSYAASPQELSAKTDAGKRRARESEPYNKEYLAQLDATTRRTSFPDALQTPPNRSAYKPSNLHYHSASRDNPVTPHVDTPQEARSRYDGTESHGSTGAATSLWDELDELKSRMKKLEMGGKIPATSGAIVAQASADQRPPTANTSATTVSSSPNQIRKLTSSDSNGSSSRIHPLLSEALVKAKQHTGPAIYRVLEATVSEALALAETTGSTGPQGAFHSSASSILGGSSSLPERQVRRKADNICRSLTELCIALCDTKSNLASPAVNRSSAAGPSRRPSLQLTGDSPSVRQSIEPESNTLPGSSPSRAMSRIEARHRTSILNTRRESVQEPSTPSISQAPSRIGVNSSMYRSRREQDDEDATLRAPSRAMTDFRDTARAAHKSRFSREYTSREPLPDLQPSVLPTRRPTVTGSGNENLLYRERDSTRRFGLNQQASPAFVKQSSLEPVARTLASNRNSLGSFPLGRTASLGRKRANGE